MNIQTINIILAIKDIEKQAGQMKYDAKLMTEKAEGMFLAAESLRKEFDTEISIYEKEVNDARK